MNIINYDTFYALKLANFVSNKEEIEILEDWEFMNAIWEGESLGFTEWIQLKDGTVGKSISLDLLDLSDTFLDKVFSILKLDLKKGMKQERIVALLGAPTQTESFAEDRITFEYLIGSEEKYYLSLTISEEDGLSYLVLMNHQETIRNLEDKVNS